jgi:serine/threonine protein kinase
MLSLEGRQLGNYTVIRRIRSGGMGAVYEGRQRSAFDRRVAIKVILGIYATDPDMRRRFAREAKIVARLHHPHILPLIEFGDEQGVLYLVMPFIEGGTLTGYLRRHLPDVHEVSTIFLQLLDAVEYAHEEGLIHRDIKSSNVLLEARRSGPPYAYLADFGLVRTIQQADLESSYAGVPIPLDQVPGTPHYMAPEQTRGIVTPATDIYALGVLLYQLLTGELPYNAADDIEVIKMHLHAPVPNPRDHDASIPAEVGVVVTHAMAKRPEERFSSVDAFRAAFLAALDGPPERIEVTPFADEEDFAVHELPPRPAPPSRPLKPPRASQQLLRLPPPEPIEFIEPPPASVRRQRTTDDHQLARRRPRTTDARNESATDIRRQRVTGDDQEPRPARRPRVAGGAEQYSSATLPLPPRSPSRKRAPAAPRALSAAAALPPRRSRRFSFAAAIGIAVPVLLILLILLPRVFGLSLLPAGFPLLGPPSVATIDLTVKSTTVHDTFLLTASLQASGEDSNARVIPDRRATGRASDNRTVATSGLQENGGTRASGALLFDNSSHSAVRFSTGFPFTASNGIQVRLATTIVVPARINGLDGTTTAPAHAVAVGQNGNIPPGELNTLCCGGVMVSNPAAFSGGSDTGVVHLVAQNDLDGVANELTPRLRQRAVQAVNGHLHPGEVQAGTLRFTTRVTSSPPTGSPANQVIVTVTVSVNALVYNTRTASDLTRQILDKEASQALGSSYQLSGPLSVTTPTVEQQGSDGQLYLSISASGLWAYTVSVHTEEQWRQAIKGASLTLAQNYLSTRPGIQAAHIQLPFGSDHLPTDATQIVFVLQQQAPPGP